jgi:DNA-directed RNA polymerase subunit L
VEVPHFRIKTITVDAENELRELTGLPSLPFVSVAVEIEIKGVPTAVPNALRRVLCDELRGRALICDKPPSTTGSTDPFMMDQFVMNRISMIALRARIPDNIVRGVRFAVDVRNDTASVMTVFSGDFKVTSGKLDEPIFDPTYEVAIIQPGHVYRAEDIRIEEGYGRDFAAYQTCVRAFLRHLDLKEAPRAATHGAGGEACDVSGYAESSLVANPRHHIIGFTVPVVSKGAAGVDDVRTVLADACKNIKERLHLVQSALAQSETEASSSSSSAAPSGAGVTFTLIDLEAGLSEGILRVKGETHTVGNLITRYCYELTPDISFCAYRCVPHEGEMRLTVRHTEDVPGIISRAVRQAYAVIDAVQHGIAMARPEEK